MRIATNTLFTSGAARLGELQTSLAKTQNQLSTGRRVLTPSDDPVAAAQALEVSQAQSLNAQFGINRDRAKSSLGMEEGVLQSVTTLLVDVKGSIVGAGNTTLDSSQRKFLAAELSGRMEELMGLANSRDGIGDYIFAGYQSTSQPFAKTATGAQYLGDQGQRMVQVGPLRQFAMSDSGDAVFEHNKTGNGTFVSAAAAANTGSGIISTGSVTNAAALTGDQYQINFTSATTYDIVDATTSTTLSSGTYVSGQSIAFDGLQLDIKGAPANGDQFTIDPSKNQSIFTTFTDLIAALNTPVSGAVGEASLLNKLNAADNNLSNALDNVLTVRASVGSRLRELDSLDSEGEDRNLQYERTLTELQSLDYTKAITTLSEQNTMLQAAQQSFVKTTSLSLFNFIS